MRYAVTLLAYLTLCGCGAGSGEGLDENGQPTNDNNNTTPGEASLAAIQTEIFTPRCAICHAGSNAPRGLRLDTLSNSFDHLVNINADQVPSLRRVAPGEPDNSYLVHKIEGRDDIVGGQMPLNNTPLSANQIAQIRQWISNGAQLSGNESTTKLQGVVEQKSTAEHTLHFLFSRPLDTNNTDAHVALVTVQTRSGSAFVNPDAYNIALQTHTLTLTIDHTQLGEWQRVDVRMNTTQSRPLYDIDSQIIDGDRDEQAGGEIHHAIFANP